MKPSSLRRERDGVSRVVVVDDNARIVCAERWKRSKRKEEASKKGLPRRDAEDGGMEME